MQRSNWVFLLAVPFMLNACVAHISGTLPPAEPNVGSGMIHVGAAKTDLTPMPGYPMGGFAIGGRISRGVWTRLYARALYMEDADGRAVAMVSCDLWSMPAGLADRVAELVAKTYGAKHLAREQIILSATHTHHSPGNFSTSAFYNFFASPKPGFDGDLFDWLSHRIAGTIAEAWKNREPARLFRGRKTVPTLSRNRSFPAFKENGDVAQEILDENAGLEIKKTPFPVGDELAYRAVDPMLTVLSAKAAADPQRVIAAAAFYAVHPTSMGPDTEVYSSDLFGVAATMVEHELYPDSQHARPTVIAVFNGAEGDISSNWESQDRPSTVALGEKLADGILALIEEAGHEMTSRIETAYGGMDLRQLARPFVGASILQGSEGDWTFLYDAGWREGLRAEDSPIPGHGTKMEPLAPENLPIDTAWLSSLILDHLAEVPESVPLAVYRIGDMAFATLPGEFTMALGRRISRAVSKAVGVEDPAVLVGLANEYLSYFTTEAEHDLQHYEGASMIYGPASAGAVEDELVKLAEAMPMPERETEVPYHYVPGIRACFGIEAFDILFHADRLRATYYTLDNVLMDAQALIPMPNDPHLVWVDENPRWPDDPRSSTRITPSVSVEISENNEWKPYRISGVPETDEGFHFVTSVVASLGKQSRWITYWLVPEEADQNAKLRLRIDGIRGSYCSPSFRIETQRARGGFLGVIKNPVP